MVSPMEVQIIARESIKPSSPTPHHLRNFKLSFFDQMAPILYTPWVFFYSKPNQHLHGDSDTLSRGLKKSLSENLTRFYPFAGKIKDHAFIDCNDDGVDFVEARIGCRLLEVLHKPDPKFLRKLLPNDFESQEAVTDRLLAAQVTFFECGGMAVGVCISHKLADASTLSTFIRSWSWAAMALDFDKSSQSVTAKPPDLLLAATLFPPKDFSVPPMKLPQNKCITRRYVFDAAKIAALKAKAASETVKQPTRVEVVTALIWKCSMDSSRSISGYPRLSLLTHTVDLRRRTQPQLPANLVGNLCGLFAAEFRESELELQALVCKLRKGLKQANENAAAKENNIGDETHKMLVMLANRQKQGEMEIYNYTSCCRFPLYEADFGWGKPIWIGVTDFAFTNIALLMDSRDGNGIEAWVTLDEEHVGLVECNEEFLEFASVNPSVSC